MYFHIQSKYYKGATYLFIAGGGEGAVNQRGGGEGKNVHSGLFSWEGMIFFAYCEGMEGGWVGWGCYHIIFALFFHGLHYMYCNCCGIA